MRVLWCAPEVFHDASRFIITNTAKTGTQGSASDEINNGAHKPAVRSTDYYTL